MQPTASLARAYLVGLAMTVTAFAAGFGVALSTAPDDDDLQRSAAEAIGVSPELLDAPIIGPLVDELTAEVRTRTVEETRGSLVAGLATALLVGTAGSAAYLYRTRSR